MYIGIHFQNIWYDTCVYMYKYSSNTVEIGNNPKNKKKDTK